VNADIAKVVAEPAFHLASGPGVQRPPRTAQRISDEPWDGLVAGVVLVAEYVPVELNGWQEPV
jgi:hypothetical protein